MSPRNPVIAFRADASLAIGTGHVMRCLTLAKALQDRGARCHFICRDLPGHLADTIRSRDIECHLLPSPDCPEDDGMTEHSGWLGVSSARDAAESLAVLERLFPDWLVVDHYALESRWERAARPEAARLMVLDDLADRPHDCDLLLDQNLGRVVSDYDGLVAPRSLRLIGPDFALLRPEFAAQRAHSLARRQRPRLRHLLVALGGVDLGDATSRILDTLATCALPQDARITIVLGPTAPALDAVARRAAEMPIRTELRVGVGNMAELMARADLAIGAAGSTSWERCCLGLPSLVAVLADNQSGAAASLSQVGAALQFGVNKDPVAGLAEAVSRAMEPAFLDAMSVVAAGLVDGQGTERVRIAMELSDLSVREAGMHDAETIYAWRYTGEAARHYRVSALPSLKDHFAWFEAALEESSRILLIICREGHDLGHVRFDLNPGEPQSAKVSICIDPVIRGTGQAQKILLAALRHAKRMGIRSCQAEVNADNAASLHLFHRLGFSETCREGAFFHLETQLSSVL